MLFLAGLVHAEGAVLGHADRRLQAPRLPIHSCKRLESHGVFSILYSLLSSYW
jgi:hypothetical protein